MGLKCATWKFQLVGVTEVAAGLRHEDATLSKQLNERLITEALRFHAPSHADGSALAKFECENCGLGATTSFLVTVFPDLPAKRTKTSFWFPLWNIDAQN